MIKQRKKYLYFNRTIIFSCKFNYKEFIQKTTFLLVDFLLISFLYINSITGHFSAFSIPKYVTFSTSSFSRVLVLFLLMAKSDTVHASTSMNNPIHTVSTNNTTTIFIFSSLLNFNNNLV